MLDIKGILDPVVAIINKVLPDKTAAAAAEAALRSQAAAGALQTELVQLQALTAAQTDIDKIEAASSSKWVSGWRPFIGWVCGVAFAYVAILEPIARFAADVFFGYKGAFPSIDTTITMQILFGLLGLGMYRTAEKIKGVASK